MNIKIITFLFCVICTLVTSKNAMAQGATCATANPFCTTTGATLQLVGSGTSAESGNNYGCLGSQPEPNWFYLQVDNPGNITIQMSATSDIDFALWGPYASISSALGTCGSLPAPVDCSFSATAVEYADITGGSTGDVYILLVTNYAGTFQTASLNQTAGVGNTDCDILCSLQVANPSPSACNTADNTHSVTVEYGYVDAPPGATINFTAGGGSTTATVNGTGTGGPFTITIPGITSTGGTITVNAAITSISPFCQGSITYTSPSACSAPSCTANNGAWNP